MRVRLAPTALHGVIAAGSDGRDRIARSGAISTTNEKPAEAAAVKPSLRSHRLSQPPNIDGVLDDEAWREGPLETGEWLSYNPLYGSSVPQKTKVWIGHDTNYLYFAFQCDDPDPSAIKTSITRRDNIWSDDWVGISLDALGTGQLSYHLMVNPNGVQLDMLNTVSGGEDQSPDYVWDSAGRRNAGGLRRRDARAAADDSLQGRSRRAHGDPLLAPGEPRGRLGRLASARAWQVGVREARLARVRRSPAAADSRGHPVDDVCTRPSSARRRHSGAPPTIRETSASAASTASRPR